MGTTPLTTGFTAVWSADATYQLGMTVIHDEAIWEAAVNNVRSEPSDINTDWTLVLDASGAGVSSLNTLTGELTLAEGSGITITPSGGDTLTFDATGSSPFLTATPHLTAAQIKAINSSPPTLIAGTANKVIVPAMIMAKLNFGTTAFSPANSQDQFMTQTSLNPWGGFDHFFFEETQNAFQAITTFISGGTVLADFVGKGLILMGDADYSAGDSTMDFTIFYYLLTP